MRLQVATKYGKRIPQLSAERLVNMYAEPATGKSNLAVYGIGGLRQFASVGDGPIMGLSQINGTLCAVSRNTVYTISNSGTGTSRGTIQNTGLVDMASNGTYICIVTGVGYPGYLFDGTTLTEITDADYPNIYFFHNIFSRFNDYVAEK